MFKSPTVFVLGAGASKEVGLPIGSELVSAISKKLKLSVDRVTGGIKGDELIVEALKRHSSTTNPTLGGYQDYYNAALEISLGLPLSNSIDEYLDSRSDRPIIEACGKLAITATILEYEQKSSLFTDVFKRPRQEMDFEALGATWYGRFFRALQSGVPNDRVASLFDNVVFVDFNYDRCLEQFLFEAVRTRYSLGDAQTKAVLERAKIFHPYGSTGRLPWREQNGALLFGGKLGPDEIIRVASQIRTFTERVVEKTDIELIKSEMQRAELVVFLGFAFHQQNMDLLRPAATAPTITTLATVYHTSDADQRVIAKRIDGFAGKSVGKSLEPMTCSDLFGKYRLTFGNA